MIKVHVASYQAVSILHGGPNTQLRKTIHCMDQHGIEASLFDSWAPFNRRTCDVFHLFAANIGTYHLAREIHTLGIPLVVSPIIYSRHLHSYVRNMLAATRVLKNFGRGLWSDYGLTAEICSWAARVLPNSQAEADLVVNGLGVNRSKVTVIPNGVEERFFNADPSMFKKEYGLENFILNVGHIGHGRKNVLALIQALAAIDHPAVIIGRIIDGEYGGACMREAAKYKHIRIIDGLSHDSPMLASAYAAADVFVLPSLFETPGIAALEAGLAGAKIVITPYGGTKEYFEDKALYVEPDSVESIRRGIVAALETKKDFRLRDHIHNEYLWPRISEKTAAVYKDLMRA